MCSTLRPTSEMSASSSNYLRLALSLVNCTQCGCMLSCSGLYRHAYLFMPTRSSSDWEVDRFESDAHYVYQKTGSVPRKFHNRLRRTKRPLEVAEAVIKLCGKDHAVVSVTEMRTVPIGLICGDPQCSDTSKKFYRDAVSLTATNAIQINVFQ